MKQIYGIVLILLSFGFACLAMPTNSESSKTDVQETDSRGTEMEAFTPEISTLKAEATETSSKPDNTTKQPEKIDNIESAQNEPLSTDIQENITDSNGTKTEAELIATPENEENSTHKSEAAETTSKPDSITQQPENIDNIESARNVDDLKSFQNNEGLKLQNIKEEDIKFKDSPHDVAPHEIHRQSEVWKDFADDFSLLQDRMPDLTDEEFDQINGDGAMPWNFLKSLDVKRNIDEIKPRPVQSYTPIYITVPIVINTHSSLPISVTIGGQKIPLKLPNETKKPSVLVSDNVKAPAGSPIVTPTSIYNKLMDYSEPPIRQTNRHRSNFRKKIYARNNEHQVEEFEYKSEEN